MSNLVEQAKLFYDNPGFQGALARLVLAWNPEHVSFWLAGEQGRCTHPNDIAKAMGEAIAAAIVGVLADMPPNIDKMAFLNGDAGLLGQVKARLEKRLSSQRTDGGILLPGNNGG